MIIGICGKNRSGKDTVANYLKDKYKFEHLYFAEPLKKAAILLFKLSPEQITGDLKETIDARYNKSPRQLLRWLGIHVFRNQFKDSFWLDYLKFSYEEIRTKNPNVLVVVSDVRFQDEIDMIKKLGGKIVKINRENRILNSNDIESDNRFIELTGFDFYINNDSTLEDLYHNIETMVKSLL